MWGASHSTLLGASLGAFVTAPFLSHARRHSLFFAGGLGACVHLTGSALKVEYDPDFDPERRSVFSQNHISMLDGQVACTAIPHAFCGLMNHWHFRIPGYGWIMKLAGSIPVYPRSAGRTGEITAAARDRAERGLSILVFPEGHRTLTGLPRPFKRGVFFMARDAGLPVVPLCVRGLYEVNHKGSMRFRPGHVQVYVGPQIETAGLDDDGVARLANAFYEATLEYVATGVLPVSRLRNLDDA